MDKAQIPAVEGTPGIACVIFQPVVENMITMTRRAAATNDNAEEDETAYVVITEDKQVKASHAIGEQEQPPPAGGLLEDVAPSIMLTRFGGQSTIPTSATRQREPIDGRATRGPA